MILLDAHSFPTFFGFSHGKLSGKYLYKPWVFIIQINSTRNKAAIVVSFVFLISAKVNPLSFMI